MLARQGAELKGELESRDEIAVEIWLAGQGGPELLNWPLMADVGGQKGGAGQRSRKDSAQQPTKCRHPAWVGCGQGDLHRRLLQLGYHARRLLAQCSGNDIVPYGPGKRRL